jgi:hypothetical protein
MICARAGALCCVATIGSMPIERREVGAPGEFEALSDDELERALSERLSALGLALDAGGETRH